MDYSLLSAVFEVDFPLAINDKGTLAFPVGW